MIPPDLGGFLTFLPCVIFTQAPLSPIYVALNVSHNSMGRFFKSMLSTKFNLNNTLDLCLTHSATYLHF